MNWAWNYLSLDPSLRLLIRPKPVRQEKKVLLGNKIRFYCEKALNDQLELQNSVLISIVKMGTF